MLVDACVLVNPLKRNLLLTLAEAEFFRVRWSDRILGEAEQAIAKMISDRGLEDAKGKAARARSAMVRAFEDASVIGYEGLIDGLQKSDDCRDPNDAHVIAAAVKTRASVIVTDNLRDFPEKLLGPLDLEAKSADAFIADTIDLDSGRAVAALRQMRERFQKPEKNADILLLDIEALGLIQTADILREHLLSL